MRFASFTTHDGVLSWGVIDGDVVRDIGSSSGRSLAGALRSGTLDELVGADAESLPLTALTLTSPVPDADKILCVGLNYADHIAEMGRETPRYPTIFSRFNDSLVGSGSALIAPDNSTKFDYEGEFAIVIGTGGRHITEADAASHIFGYTIMNDGSLRDYQRHTTQFTPGKNFPSSGSLGPWVVTVDEFGAIGTQRIRTTVNGETVQDSTLDHLVFGAARLISYISEWTELSPGDIIATGTPGGVGDGRTPALYLRPGDTVSVEIESLGTLTNTVASELRP